MTIDWRQSLIRLHRRWCGAEQIVLVRIFTMVSWAVALWAALAVAYHAGS